MVHNCPLDGFMLAQGVTITSESAPVVICGSCGLEY